MFNIAEVIESTGLAEDISVDAEGTTDHVLAYFPSGVVLSVLRGERPLMGGMVSETDGLVEAAILKMTLQGLRPYDIKDETTLMEDLDEDGLKAAVKRASELPELSIEDIFGDNIISLF